MSKLICKVRLGALNQDVLIQENDTVEAYQMPLKDISTFIIENQDIKEVYLGGTESFMKKIQQEVKQLELAKYSTTKINFHYI